MTTLDERVCPRCGEAAAEQRFCGSCGLNIWEERELPTRAEWELARARANEPGKSTDRISGTETAARLPDALNTSDPDATERTGSRPSKATTFYRAQSTRVRISLVMSAVVALIIVVAVAAGGSQGIAQDPTHCDSLCGDTAFGQPTKWPNGSAVTVACSDVNAGTTQNSFAPESIAAAVQYCTRNPGTSVNIELSGP